MFNNIIKIIITFLFYKLIRIFWFKSFNHLYIIMQTILLKILHYIWYRKDNIYSLYKSFKDNPNIKFYWNIAFSDIKEYTNTTYTWLKIIKDDSIVSGNDYLKKLDPRIGKNTNKNLIQYKQSENSCAIYGNTRSLIYNTWEILTRTEVEEISEYAITKGYRERNEGMTFKNAARSSEEWMLENKNIKIETIRTPYKSEQYNALKELWYACALWGYWTREKTLDIQDDAIIDYNYTWTEKKIFGHCWTEEEAGEFTNNYPDYKVNRWKNDIFEEFITNGYNFVWCYFPIVVGDTNKITLKDAISAKNAWIWNGNRPQDSATREETAAMIYRGINSMLKF